MNLIECSQKQEHVLTGLDVIHLRVQLSVVNTWAVFEDLQLHIVYECNGMRSRVPDHINESANTRGIFQSLHDELFSHDLLFGDLRSSRMVTSFEDLDNNRFACLHIDSQEDF